MTVPITAKAKKVRSSKVNFDRKAVFQAKFRSFINEACAKPNSLYSNKWLKFGSTEIYLRVSTRRIYQPPHDLTVVLDISTVATPIKDQRKGRFGELLVAIREVTDLPLYVENAFPEFAKALQGEKYGFTVVSSTGYSLCLFRNEILETPNMVRVPIITYDNYGLRSTMP